MRKEMKTASVIFCRSQPPTTDHLRIYRDVVAHAKYKNGDAMIFLSRTEDELMNPLDFETRAEIIKSVMPDLTIIDEPEVTDPFKMLFYLADKGYTHVYNFVGQDRIEYHQRAQRYATDTLGMMSYDMVYSGHRSSADKSGTYMRNLVANGKEQEFYDLSEYDINISKKIYSIIQEKLCQ